VRQGQVIARSGNTGRGGDAYLHFEIRKGGEAVNPEPYLP
jgi:murein DD-endopeptidase MepM/ murein hydrolase activator NlpD